MDKKKVLEIINNLLHNRVTACKKIVKSAIAEKTSKRIDVEKVTVAKELYKK